MNFMEAVKAMKEGKKVRRRIFDQDVYYSTDGFRVINDEKDSVRMDTDNMEATDWEIYEEEDNWNLASKNASARTGFVPMYELGDIKTFIKKVKEDVVNKYEDGPTEGNLITPEGFNKIIDKRSGRL